MATQITAPPPGVPAWMWNQLESLSAKGQLFGVPPSILAAELRVQNGDGGTVSWPSGQSSAGDGQFGVGAHTYTYPTIKGFSASGTSFTLPSSLFYTSATSAFNTLARAAAAVIAYWAQQNNGNLQAGVNMFDTGYANQGDGAVQLAESWGYTVPDSGFVPNFNPQGASTKKLTQDSTRVAGPNPFGFGGDPNGQIPGIITGAVKSGLTSIGKSAVSDITNPITSELGSIASDWSDRIIGGLEIAGGLIIMLAGIFLLVKEESAKALVSGLTGATRGATSPAPAAEALPEPPEAPEAVSEPVEASGDILPGGEEEEEPPDLPVTGGPPEEVLSGETTPSGADLDDLLDAAFAEGYWKGQGEPPPSSAARDAARRAGEAEPMNAGILVDALDVADLEAF